MDLTPKTSLLDSQRHQNLAWKTILGEFIDNAFDASATRISFSFNKKTLKIMDDGNGCDDLQRMLTLGAHREHKETQLGTYGVGAKDAAISAADGITIISVRHGMRHSVSLDWRRLEKSGSWTNCPDPIQEATAESNGTLILLDPLRSDHKPNEDLLVKALSLQYTPAIRDGRQIILQMGAKKQQVTIPEYRFPPLEHQITADLEISGKAARVTMGIVPENRSVEMSGLQISYGYRVITTGSRLGLGEAPTPNLFGWVELGRGWELTKNKDNVSSNLDALGKAINSACKTTIDIASKRATNVLFDGVAAQVNQALRNVMDEISPQGRKAVRGKGSKAGTVASKKTGRRHLQAAITQPGDTFSSRGGRASSIKVAFESMNANGPASRFQGNVVYLNKDIPNIRDRMNDEQAIAVHAIYAVATFLADDPSSQKHLCEYHSAEKLVDRSAQIAGMLLTKLRNVDSPALRTVG